VPEKLIEQVTDHVYLIDAEAMNVFLIAAPEGLALIDTGFPGTMALIDQAVRSLGWSPEEIGHVLVTHCHPDHAGGLAEVKQATGAVAWMHPADAEMVRMGTAFRPYEPAPGLNNRLFITEVIEKSPTSSPPANVDKEVLSGEIIPVAGGVKAIGTPGHTAGHLAFLWPGDGGVLFVGDVAKHVDGLELSPIYEDLAQGRQDLSMLAGLEFETACFAHGAPIVGGAAAVFRKKWVKEAKSTEKG
jgi:glyoxylase-like metal-dependent hydrolase (beta-lactamase superfamily II)